MSKVLIPLPKRDFDPTESGVPWKLLCEHGHTVEFATPDGLPAEADPRIISGNGFQRLRFLPINAQASAILSLDIYSPALTSNPNNI